jgi:hypothetical protein
MALCNLCNETVANERLLDHVRLFHPDQYEDVDTWPDGAVLVVDVDLDPEDFE